MDNTFSVNVVSLDKKEVVATITGAHAILSNLHGLLISCENGDQHQFDSQHVAVIFNVK